MTRSEAGKLGAEKSAKTRKINKLKRLEEKIANYNENPKYCLYCGNKLDFEKRFGKFCSSSCSASYNNRKRSNNNTIDSSTGTFITIQRNYCQNCNKEISIVNKFCSIECDHEYKYRDYITKWKAGEVDGQKGEYSVSNYIKRYLIKKYNNQCQICGWNEVNKYTNKIPLEVHHIDGNYKNNSEDNLQLLCPNCHSLTNTYKAANKNGRKERSKYKI